jgi:hypothetical protein
MKHRCVVQQHMDVLSGLLRTDGKPPIPLKERQVGRGLVSIQLMPRHRVLSRGRNQNAVRTQITLESNDRVLNIATMVPIPT